MPIWSLLYLKRALKDCLPCVISGWMIMPWQRSLSKHSIICQLYKQWHWRSTKSGTFLTMPSRTWLALWYCKYFLFLPFIICSFVCLFFYQLVCHISYWNNSSLDSLLNNDLRRPQKLVNSPRHHVFPPFLPAEMMNLQRRHLRTEFQKSYYFVSMALQNHYFQQSL